MKLEEVEKALLALPLVIAEVMEEASMKQRTADHFICRHSLLQREIPGIKTRQPMSNKMLTIAYYFQKMKGIFV